MREQLVEAVRREGLQSHSTEIRVMLGPNLPGTAAAPRAEGAQVLSWGCEGSARAVGRQHHASSVSEPAPSNICFIFFQRSTKGAVVILGSRPTAEEKDPRSATGTV